MFEADYEPSTWDNEDGQRRHLAVTANKGSSAPAGGANSGKPAASSTAAGTAGKKPTATNTPAKPTKTAKKPAATKTDRMLHWPRKIQDA